MLIKIYYFMTEQSSSVNIMNSKKHIASFLEQIKALLVVSLCALMEMNCR